MKAFRPVLFLAIVLVLVGLACSAVTGGEDTPEQPVVTEEPVQVVTEAPTKEPTAEPTEEIVETEAPSPAEDFFTEEFDEDPSSNWSLDILGKGAEEFGDTADVSFSDSRMRVEIPNKNLYVYYSYLGQEYEDVRIDLRADNRGVNYNNVSLFCRAGADGWYEWSVRSDGLWDLYAVTDGYNNIANGGTNSLKQGKEVNEYTMICKGKTISMFVNGEELKLSPITDTKYALRSGQVGFNISSLERDILPVIVEVDWFKISEP